MSDDPAYLTATEALQLFRSKKLSPVELLKAIIARTESVEEKINAFAFTYFDEALDAARLAEQAYMDNRPRPLEGIPVAIKDENEIAGKITTNGSLLLKDYVPQQTDVVSQRLMDAGAIIHARTTTPEFSASFVTCSRLWGVTRNPWNPDFTPGGSSGGSGAGLAAGTTTLASGTDIAGSVRVPAALNGVIGFKPPYGRVPQTPPWNLDTFCHEGSMARTVRDCILMQNVIAGPHPSDITTLKPKLEIPLEFDGIKDWRIAYSIDLGYIEVDDDVRRNTLGVLKVFRQLGAKVEEVDLGWNRKCLKTAIIHWTHLNGGILRRDFGKPEMRDQLTGYVRAFLDRSETVPVKNVIAAMEYAGEMYRSLGRLFENYDLLVVPTTATTQVAADFDNSSDELFINDKKVDPLLGWVLTYPFNILSRCPVLNIPTGLAANHVPTGIQLVGPTYDDTKVFQAGAACEAARGVFINELNRPFISN